MHQLIQFSVVYSYDRTSRLRKNGTASVTIRAYQGGEYRYFNTSVYIEPRHWCKRTLRVKQHPRTQLFNRQITQTLRKLEECEYDRIQFGGTCTLADLTLDERKRPLSCFITFFRREMEKEKSRVAPATYDVYEQTLSKLEAHRSTWPFASLRSSEIRDFLTSLYDQGLQDSSVHKHLKNVKKFVRLAGQQGYWMDHRNPTDGISVRVKKSDPLFLYKEELEAFEQYQAPLDKPLWHLAKQCFLFSCYTGLRWCDFSRLTDDHFFEVQDGLELSFKAQKNTKSYRQNLRKLGLSKNEAYSDPERIVRDRLDNDDYWPGEQLFPFNHRNSYARILKKIARSLPVRPIVQKRISSHTGRHTFGTHMAMRVQPHVLQRLMQHSNLRETLVYVHLSRQMVDEALDNAKW